MREIAPGLGILRRRSDFVVATRDAIKIGGPLIGLQLRCRDRSADTPRIGFTVTKRVGNAVERNRMKRRLRVAARQALAGAAQPGCDYVLVARRALLEAPFDRIVRELGEAVRRAHGRARNSAHSHAVRSAGSGDILQPDGPASRHANDASGR